MEVSISFSADGHRYNLTRAATIDSNGLPRVVADLRIDAEVVQKAAIDQEIGRLLHPQISEFFLFDGELLRDFYDRLNSERERDLLRSSIETVLGIPALQLAAHDVSIMRDDVLGRQVRQLKDQALADTNKRKIAELNSRKESVSKDRAEVSAALRAAKQDLEDLRQAMAEVEDLKADARELELLESQIAGGDSTAASLREDMANLLARGWMAPASARLAKALSKVRERNDAAQARQAEVERAVARVALLQERVRGGSCPSCEQPLPPADAATRQELDEAETTLTALRAGVGDGADFAAERRIQTLIDTRTVDLYRDKQSQLDRLESTQYDRRRRLNSIKDRLKDNDAASIRQMGQRQEALERAIDDYARQMRSLEDIDGKINADLNKLAASLKKHVGGQPALAAETFFFEYVSDLVTRTIAQYRERTRSEVEATANKMFMKLMRDSGAYSGLTVTKDYHVDLQGRHGPAMRTSEGGRQLIALSLIGALKQAAVRGGPVVLDSPLARLDLEHRENVLTSWVPELGNQAILLVQSGELTEPQARSIMGSRIGHAYRIYRPSDDPEIAAIERVQ